LIPLLEILLKTPVDFCSLWPAGNSNFRPFALDWVNQIVPIPKG
jgi:hypothetical protein